MPTSLNILIADDDAFMRRGIKTFFQRHDYHLAEAADGQETLGYLTWFDVVILDMAMPEHHRSGAKRVADMGLQLTHRIKTERPEAGVVLLSAYDDHSQAILNLLHQGHRGLAYLLKGVEPERVLQAVQITAVGGSWFDPDLMIAQAVNVEENWLKNSVVLMDSLTKQEVKVVECTAQGLSAQATADKLALEVKTVTNYLTTIYKKLALPAEPACHRKAVLLTRVYTAYTQHKTKLG